MKMAAYAIAVFGLGAGVYLWRRAIIMSREAQGRGYYDGTLEAYYGTTCIAAAALIALIAYYR